MARRWAKEEVKYIIDNWKAIDVKSISSQLNRTINSCYGYASKLKTYKIKKWSEKEDNFLIENWKNTNVKDIAIKLKRTIYSCKGRAAKLKLIRIKDWTKEEKEFVQNNWLKLSMAQISLLLNRTVPACQKQARKMKISKYKDRAWLKEDLDKFRNLYGNMSNKELSELFSKSIGGISQKAKKLNLRKSDEFLLKMYVPSFKGLKHSKVSKKRIGNKSKRLWKENREKIMLSQRGKKRSLETRLKMSKSMKGYRKSIQHKRNISIAKKGIPNYKLKQRWQDPDFGKRFMSFQHVKPNKPEQFIDSILQSNFHNEWKLNVKGETILNGKVPDWINCNGQKKVILFNGIYWHLWRFQKNNPDLTKQRVEERERNPYEELGFSVLHIWEDELINTEQIIQKINEFARR